MSVDYGFFSKNIYRIAGGSRQCEKPIQVTNMASNISSYVDTVCRLSTIDVQMNVSEYYDKETNDQMYQKLLQFIAENKITSISVLDNMVKVEMDYTIQDACGNIIDEGVRIVPSHLNDCMYTLGVFPDNTLPYRKGRHIECRFGLERIRRGYGVSVNLLSNPPIPVRDNPLIFKVNNVRVLGVVKESCRSTRKLGPSSINTTMSRASSTLESIRSSSVELFGTESFGIQITAQHIPGIVSDVNVLVKIMLPCCEAHDELEIMTKVNENGGSYYPFNPNGNIQTDSLDPLIHRPPCPGSLPHETHTFWQDGCDIHTHHHHSCNNGQYPIKPDPGWTPDNVAKIDPCNIKATDIPGLYTEFGNMIYTWKDMILNGSIVEHTNTIISADIKPPVNIPFILVIPDTITAIDPSVFFANNLLVKIFLPESIHSIDMGVFYQCTALNQIFVSSELESIGDHAFQGCEKLEIVNLPGSLKTIGDLAFSHCKILKITLPAEVAVGAGAFDEVFKVRYPAGYDISTWGTIIFTEQINN